MNSKQIDYCIELAHTLNFTRAAENQFVSQPTFSYQIKLLEDEIGFAIFERSGKGASLTPAGEQFVLTLTSIRDQMKRAVEQGQNFSAKYNDSISINMMTRSSIYFLPEAIRIMADERPDVQIQPQRVFHGRPPQRPRGQTLTLSVGGIILRFCPRFTPPSFDSTP